MKLAFSTLGCPDWTWEDIFATARDLGIQGIEVRGVGNELNAAKIRPFLPGHIENTKQRLASAGMEIPMLASSICIGTKGSENVLLTEAKAYIDLASKLGTPYIRVMCSGHPEPDTRLDMDFLRMIYTEICEYAGNLNVVPLIETNGELADSRVMADFIASVGNPNNGVLWDIHHPFRYFGEKPEQTAAALGDKIKYIHVKDSVRKGDQVQYRMMGYGDVPVLDALRSAGALGYNGYVSLEWVKRWNPDLEEPGVVFAHYVNYMDWLMKSL